jgi:hypothetical protein
VNNQIFIDHYAKLALKPGWIDYVRHQVKLMEQEPAFHGIGKLIAKRIKELNADRNV